MPTTLETRRPRQARSEATRRALVEAAVQSLLALGFAKTTTLEVQRRAGASRGALLHHFPTKASMLVAAIGQVAKLRGREMDARVDELPVGAGRTSAALDVLWESFSGPVGTVAIELHVAARTDPELREVLQQTERVLREHIWTQSRLLFGTDSAQRPGFDAALDLTLQMMMGTAMTAILHGDAGHAERLIETWKQVFPTLLERAKT